MKERENGARRGPDPESITLIEALGALRRQRRWAAAAFAVPIAIAAAITFLGDPVYRAYTTLRVEEQSSTAVPVLDALSELARGAKVETEMQILRSRRIAEGVVEDLGLHAGVEHPDGLPRDSLFAVFSAPRGAAPGRYRVYRGPERFELIGPGGAGPTGRYGSTVRTGGLRLGPRPPASDDGDAIAIDVERFQHAVIDLQEELDVLRPEREASIIEVAYESTDPLLARDVVNATTRHFLALRNDMQKHRASAAVEFLREQVANVESQLGEAEASLEEFRENNLVLQVEAQVTEDVRRLAELQVRRNEMEIERDALRQVLDELREDPAGQSWAELASFPSFLQTEAATAILEQLTRLETERSRLLATRLEDDADVRNIEATIQLLGDRLATLLGSHLRGLNERLASLDGALARFSTELEKLPAVEIEYARHRRSTDVLGQLYTFLQTRLKEAEISEAVEVANVQVVDPAIAPIQPVKPRKLLNLMLGALLGLGCAAGMTALRESLDTRVRSRDELEDLTGLPVLAMIPPIPSGDGRARGLGARIESRLVTHHHPRSAAAEAYRALRTGLTFTGLEGDGRPVRTLVFTSPEPRDGKSTTAANVALTLAEQGTRTLLIECDLRRPVLNEVFEIAAAPGLAEALTGRAQVEEVARAAKVPAHVQGSLDVIPAGGPPPNPAELLGSVAMRRLLERVRERYDAVLLDTPPVNLVTDAALLGGLADGVVIVARQGGTHRSALRLACGELRRVGARIVGTVLNEWSEGSREYGYGYRGYYRRERAPAR